MTSNPKQWNQKLSQREKLWCQMCRKQCKDQNGFEMHCKSKAHIDAMSLFATDPEKFIAKFSTEFERAFLDVARVKHNFDVVRLNVVYAQYLGDSIENTRLSATRWGSILDFAKHLKSINKIELLEGIDPQSKGTIYSIKLVDVDKKRREKEIEDQAVKASSLRSKEEAALSREYAKRARAVMEAANKKNPETEKPTMYHDTNTSVKMTMDTRASVGSKTDGLGFFEDGADSSEKKPKKQKQEPTQKPIADRPWPLSGISVKIVHKTLKDGKYHNKKGVVLTVSNEGYSATVQTSDPPAKLSLDQAYLQTVIPKLGNPVVILSGQRRGETGTLIEMLPDKFSGIVKMAGGDRLTVPYEGFSKAVAK
eukprot:TRINITY_DN16313_c0_g1_i1.p1 TRINITY_DN16313_c0_g1~~TRINITY_DN16313_c0_g1_i1.p1  ORF type:complete len:366 (+),score=66.96 TRINITY_DN16313_c0_g1_i1:42-1139(+)